MQSERLCLWAQPQSRCCTVLQDEIAYSIEGTNPVTNAFYLQPKLGNITLTQSLLGTTIDSYTVSASAFWFLFSSLCHKNDASPEQSPLG